MFLDTTGTNPFCSKLTFLANKLMIAFIIYILSKMFFLPTQIHHTLSRKFKTC